jgi:hypothetical protein
MEIEIVPETLHIKSISVRLHRTYSPRKLLTTYTLVKCKFLKNILIITASEKINALRSNAHNLYCSPSIIRIIKKRRMRWAGYVARMGEKRNAYRILVGKPEGKRPLGRPRHRSEDNIKMDLREIGWGGMDWIDLAQDGG